MPGTSPPPLRCVCGGVDGGVVPIPHPAPAERRGLRSSARPLAHLHRLQGNQLSHLPYSVLAMYISLCVRVRLRANVRACASVVTVACAAGVRSAAVGAGGAGGAGSFQLHPRIFRAGRPVPHRARYSSSSFSFSSSSCISLFFVFSACMMGADSRPDRAGNGGPLPRLAVLLKARRGLRPHQPRCFLLFLYIICSRLSSSLVFFFPFMHLCACSSRAGELTGERRAAGGLCALRDRCGAGRHRCREEGIPHLLYCDSLYFVCVW